MRFGEDIDFSIRIFKAGYKCRLFPKAWVWHKRRTDFRKFWRQVYNSGIARINLYKKYPESLKLVHLLPMVFTLGIFGTIAIWALGLFMFNFGPDHMNQSIGFAVMELAMLCTFFILLYCIALFADSTRKNRSLKIGALSVVSAFIQLMGYGCGFLNAWWRRCVLGKSEFAAFEKTFYK